MRPPLPSVPETEALPVPAGVGEEANTRMTLADFTDAKLIIPSLWGKDVSSVIQELSQRLQQERRIPDFLPFYHAALNREFMGATDVEAGMAFPHARIPGLKTLSFALGRSRERLPWGARMVRSVRLVFLIAIPACDVTQYLWLIAGLARLGRDHRVVEQLHAARNAAEMLAALKQVEFRTRSPLNLMKKAAR